MFRLGGSLAAIAVAAGVLVAATDAPAPAPAPPPAGAPVPGSDWGVADAPPVAAAPGTGASPPGTGASPPGRSSHPGRPDPEGAARFEPRPAPRGRWSWPLEPRPSVVRGFDPPVQRWAAGHRGVDLRARAGTPVLAPADGIVAFAGHVAGRPVLSVDHAGGLRSTYEPVSAAVTAGQAVRRGQVLGTLASVAGHCAPAGCLHWGSRRGEEYVDPLRLVGAHPVVLLPLR